MRRKDRDLGEEKALQIIDKCEYAVISCLNDEGEIFSVPISIVREGKNIYIHGAKAGSKAELLKNGREVTLVCVGSNQVPRLSDSEFTAIKNDGAKLGNLVFTTEYESAIAKARAYIIDDESEKYRTLEILSRKYLPDFMSAYDVAAHHGLKATNMYRLEIYDLSAKAKVLPKNK